MKIVTAAEMREIDRITTAKYGIPSLTLMENAGDAVARFILRPYSGANRRITVICGKGNNGGDGFVAARRLHEEGKDVVVLLLARPEELKGDAKQTLEQLPFPPISVTSPAELESREALFSNTDVIVDAIFGTGFRPPLPQLAAKAVELIGKSSARVVSVDLPTGIDADSFAVEHPDACRSDAIVTFTAPKPALIFGTLTRGPITVHSIGSPAEIIQSKLGLEWNNPPAILRRERQLNSHKGLYGHALIIGGSLGKSGAPAMASTAALRIGAGLVTCAVPRGILPIVAGYTPELMTEALDENASGRLSTESLAEPVANELLERKNVAAVGPGLGGDPDTVQAIRSFVARCPLPTVIDADGLNAFAGHGNPLNGSNRPLVLTPHPGEMARLTGKKTSEIGWRTLIADPRGNIWVNTTGNPGLAKGGSGDVLTGMIAGLIAQFPESIVDAVRAAVYLHGFAADLTLQRLAPQTMLATDIFRNFSAAWRSVAGREEGFVWIQRGMRLAFFVPRAQVPRGTPAG
jgi:hydroxyethylthiazole kinase-like uncharacterized protein yjeF